MTARLKSGEIIRLNLVFASIRAVYHEELKGE